VQPHPLAPLVVQPDFVTGVLQRRRALRRGWGLPRVVQNTRASRWVNRRSRLACRERCARSSRAGAGSRGTGARLEGVFVGTRSPLVPNCLLTVMVFASKSTSPHVRPSALTHTLDRHEPSCHFERRRPARGHAQGTRCSHSVATHAPSVTAPVNETPRLSRASRRWAVLGSNQ
jgi:hypothetical protein